MENMDYVARAKQLLAKQARTAALVIVPLAAAVAAQAGAISVALPTTNLTCTATVSGGSQPGSSDCTPLAGIQQLTDPGNGIQGLKFFTTGPVTLLASGSSASINLVTFGALGGGSLAGGSGGAIPLSFVFALSSTSGSLTGWAIDFAISVPNIGNAGAQEGLAGGSLLSSTVVGEFITSGTTSGGTISGSGSLVLNGPVSGSVFVSVDVIANHNDSSGFINISIPQNSADYNPIGAVGTPEPGSMGLLGSALAGLGLWWRRKRR